MTDKITKFIDSLDKKTKTKLKKKLSELKADPYGSKDIKKLKGFQNNLYRFRIGKIRIIYQLINNEIEIVDIDYRGNIY